ncbi:MAG: radical SAM protein [Lachnospiraceae bacterium]|nr:radical SAM protein [Lachnospiraceae bacterium]
MTDYIAQVAEFLQKGETVIFYTVGSDTFLNIKELKFRFGLLPTAVCDKDPNKQGRTWKGLEGVAVISPKEAMTRYPETKWFIPSLDFRFQIIGYLTQECDIAPGQIINYTPVRMVKSCEYWHKSIIYDRTGELRFCWRNPGPKVSAGKLIAVKEFCDLRDRLLKAAEEGCIPEDSPCANCPQIKEDFFPVQPKEWFVNYFCNSVCNFRCSYCTLRHVSKVETDRGRHTLRNVLESFKKEKMLDEYYGVAFSTAGEPTLYPGRNDAYQAFDGAQFLFNTNGFLYDEGLFELMSRRKVLVVDSIDAGTQETFQKIKGVNGFDRVRENLRKYAQAPMGIVSTKFIFIPGINDTPEDVDGFINFCVDVDATFAMIALDYFGTEKITARTKEMVNRLITGLRFHGILSVLFGSYNTIEYRAIMSSLVD